MVILANPRSFANGGDGLVMIMLMMFLRTVCIVHGVVGLTHCGAAIVALEVLYWVEAVKRVAIE